MILKRYVNHIATSVQGYRLLPLLGVLVWLLGSCTEIKEPVPLTYTQLLTGTEKKTWLLTSFEIIDEGEGTGDIPAAELFDNNCERDDEYVFYAGSERKYEFSNGPVKCSPTEAEILLTDRWTFTNANATLEFAFPLLAGGNRLPFIVKSLTADRMVLEIYLGEDIDASYRFIFTAKTR